MATRDCIEPRHPGLRNYPHRLHGSARNARFEPTVLCVLESNPELDSGQDLLGRLNDARCFLQCAANSLMARDESGFYSPELVCPRHGLELLREAYNDLDVRLLHHASPPHC